MIIKHLKQARASLALACLLAGSCVHGTRHVVLVDKESQAGPAPWSHGAPFLLAEPVPAASGDVGVGFVTIIPEAGQPDTIRLFLAPSTQMRVTAEARGEYGAEGQRMISTRGDGIVDATATQYSPRQTGMIADSVVTVDRQGGKRRNTWVWVRAGKRADGQNAGGWVATGPQGNTVVGFTPWSRFLKEREVAWNGETGRIHRGIESRKEVKAQGRRMIFESAQGQWARIRLEAPCGREVGAGREVQRAWIRWRGDDGKMTISASPQPCAR